MKNKLRFDNWNGHRLQIRAIGFTIKYMIEQGIPANKIKVTKTDRLVAKSFGLVSQGVGAVNLSNTTEAFVITIN